MWVMKPYQSQKLIAGDLVICMFLLVEKPTPLVMPFIFYSVIPITANYGMINMTNLHFQF